MQWIKKTVLLGSIVLATAFGPSLKAQSACDRLWATDSELWVSRGSDAKLLLVDAGGVLMPRWSPRGDRIAYAHKFRIDHPVAEIIIADNIGRRVRSLPIPADSAVNALDQLGWRDERHLFIEGHVNPSTSEYLEWGVVTGHLVAEKAGSWFAVSPDGRFVAQRRHVPHGAPPPYDSAILLVNDKRVYPLVGDTSYHRFFVGPSWSPDNQLAIIDVTTQATTLVVLAPADPSKISRLPLAGIAAPRELSWSGKSSVLIQTQGGEAWQASVSTGKIRGATRRRKTSEAIEEPRNLRNRLHGAPAHFEDSRCTDGVH